MNKTTIFKILSKEGSFLTYFNVILNILLGKPELSNLRGSDWVTVGDELTRATVTTFVVERFGVGVDVVDNVVLVSVVSVIGMSVGVEVIGVVESSNVDATDWASGTTGWIFCIVVVSGSSFVILDTVAIGVVISGATAFGIPLGWGGGSKKNCYEIKNLSKYSWRKIINQ